MLRYAVFDLDNTLYPPSSGLWAAIGQRIGLFMVERLGMRPEEVTERRRAYLNAFGTTLTGLMHDYDIDPGEFLRFAHDLPLEKYLCYDAALDEMLERLPLRKVIFTNADAAHASRVLSHLGISGHFDRIVDILTLGLINKPDRRAYDKLLRLISARPQECLFVEDSVSNLHPARELGMLTVLVSEDADAAGAHLVIKNVKDLDGILKSR
jgi:putative hydrolase of the HAD superfamily